MLGESECLEYVCLGQTIVMVGLPGSCQSAQNTCDVLSMSISVLGSRPVTPYGTLVSGAKKVSTRTYDMKPGVKPLLLWPS